MPDSEQKTILFLTADPTNEPRLRLGREIRDVQERLNLSKFGRNYNLNIELSVRINRLNFLIRNSNPCIVHFSCHGTKNGELCFEDDDGISCALEAKILSKLFKSVSKRVECVVINACYSEDQAKAISENIGFVIGMNQAIGDKAAIAFSVGFYGAIGAGNTIEEAYESGCIEIETSGVQRKGIDEFLFPVLYKKMDDEGNEESTSIQSGKKMEAEKIVLVARGTFNETDRATVEALFEHLQELCPDMKLTMNKITVEKGSIRIAFDGNQEDFERIQELLKSGQLDNIPGLSIEQVAQLRQIELSKFSANARRLQVPMMFRAQVNGRCQLQRLDTERSKNREAQDSELWADEWVDKAYPNPPIFDAGVQTRVFTINWRFVTNGGQDDGIIRPVIGAYGWPFYPGSSMKGIFRSACTPGQADRYCGKERSGGDFEPGILRFHGGYPTSTAWTEQLVDLIHPQQERQVQREKTTSAFAQISLYQPTLQFGISIIRPLSESEQEAQAEWEEIWKIWEKALTQGIGCRVSAGYGQVTNHAGQILYQCCLRGQGQAPELLDGNGEFRPNIFRAALRGHALRLFGGLTSAENAEQLVNDLFGSVRGSGDVGLLAMSFQPDRLDMDNYGRDRWEKPTYDVEGTLYWMLNRPLHDRKQRKALTNLVTALMHFSVILGGFGKSWRRADHRLFYPDYADQDFKPLIGCHWQWANDSLIHDSKVRKPDNIASFITAVRKAARNWIQAQPRELASREWASDWREAWHPRTVQMWCRVAESAEDSRAVYWLHGPYRPAIPSAGIREGSIYRSSVTGRLGQIGRLWHRMYPIVRLVKHKDDPDGKPIAKKTPQYLELLTLFPDDSAEFSDFLQYLEDEQTLFQKVWPQ